MAKLWITELGELSGLTWAPIPVGKLPPVAEQTVDFTTATQSAAFNDSTRHVRVRADANCHIAVGTDPTADTDSLPLGEGSAEYFDVQPGHKLSVVAAS